MSTAQQGTGSPDNFFRGGEEVFFFSPPPPQTGSARPRSKFCTSTKKEESYVGGRVALSRQGFHFSSWGMAECFSVVILSNACLKVDWLEDLHFWIERIVISGRNKSQFKSIIIIKQYCHIKETRQTKILKLKAFWVQKVFRKEHPRKDQTPLTPTLTRWGTIRQFGAKKKNRHNWKRQRACKHTHTHRYMNTGAHTQTYTRTNEQTYLTCTHI